MTHKQLWWALCGCIILFIADRVTKLWALHNCLSSWYINRFFSCEVMLNRGVSWSFFSFDDDTRFFVLSGIIIIITLILMVYAWRQYNAGASIWGELLIITGSCSNVIDRLLYGGVVDFLLLSYNTWSWPVFNIADMCIVFGVFILFLQLYKK